MSTDEDAIKTAYREFLDLMPLTVAIAGLPDSSGGRSFTTEQMEARAQVMAKRVQAGSADGPRGDQVDVRTGGSGGLQTAWLPAGQALASFSPPTYGRNVFA